MHYTVTIQYSISRLFMQCSGIILNTTTDLQLVLILLSQVRPFATRRLLKEDNGRPVRRIYGTRNVILISQVKYEPTI